MAGFRYPGPLCQMEHWLEVQDGTTAAVPTPRPGPVGQCLPRVAPAADPPSTAARDWLNAAHPFWWSVRIPPVLLEGVLVELNPDAHAGLRNRRTAAAEELIAENPSLWDEIQLGLDRGKAIQRVLSGLAGAGLDHPMFLEVRWSVQDPTAQWELWKRRRSAHRMRVHRRVRTVEALYEIYDELCRREFAEIEAAGLRAAFDNPIREWGVKVPNGWPYYQWVRAYYYKEHFTRPHDVLKEIQAGAKFLGRPIVGGVHPLLLAILKKAEASLTSMGENVFQQVGSALRQNPEAFVPRPQNDPKFFKDHAQGKLSNHALGQSIDLDPMTNPLIVQEEAKKIDEVLGYLKVPHRFRQSFLEVDHQTLQQRPEEEARALYGAMKEISDAIQRFLAQWLDPRENWMRRAKAQQDAKAREALASEYRVPEFDHVATLVSAFGGYEGAKFYRERGLITLPVQLFIALKQAGAKTGLEYRDRKDVMHFEVPAKVQETWKQSLGGGSGGRGTE